MLCTYQKWNFIVPVLIYNDRRGTCGRNGHEGGLLSIARSVRQRAGKGMSWTLGAVWMTALILYYWLSGR